jgi:hypothetical protein
MRKSICVILAACGRNCRGSGASGERITAQSRGSDRARAGRNRQTAAQQLPLDRCRGLYARRAPSAWQRSWGPAALLGAGCLGAEGRLGQGPGMVEVVVREGHLGMA